MELVTEVSVKLPSELVYFDYLTMDLDRRGVRIKAKSPTFAEWIRTSQTLSSSPQALSARHPLAQLLHPATPEAGTPLFYIPLDTWSYHRSEGIAHPNYTDYFPESDKPNLFWLFHSQLGEGMDLLWQLPISLNNWEDYFTSCCRAVQDIWAKELRRVTLSAKFKELLEGKELYA